MTDMTNWGMYKMRYDFNVNRADLTSIIEGVDAVRYDAVILIGLGVYEHMECNSTVLAGFVNQLIADDKMRELRLRNTQRGTKEVWYHIRYVPDAPPLSPVPDELYKIIGSPH